MTASDRDDSDEIRRRARVGKADGQGADDPEGGVRLPAPGYTADDQAGFPGTDEPNVAPGDWGTTSPEPSLPQGDDQDR